MKRGLTILTLIFSACLLLGGQALADQHESKASESWSDSAEMAAVAPEQNPELNKAQIKEMQRLLQEQGYEVGNIDGTLNAETNDAIQKFQSAEGLPLTGMPDRTTLQALAPNSDQQEFFGLSPEYGEMKEGASEESESKSY